MTSPPSPFAVELDAADVARLRQHARDKFVSSFLDGSSLSFAVQEVIRGAAARAFTRAVQDAGTDLEAVLVEAFTDILRDRAGLTAKIREEAERLIVREAAQRLANPPR